MKLPAIPIPYMVAGAALLAAVAYVSIKGAKGTGQAIGGGAVDLVNGVIEGSVTGVGEAVGIPATDMTECQRAMAEGRTWDASFACPAAEFIRYLRG